MARILIVDDEAAIRKLIRTIFQEEGHTVLEASDAEAAYRLVDERPDAIFVDVAMPGEPGPQFVLNLRKQLSVSDLPATFVTGHVSRAKPVFEAGIAGAQIITKPFTREQLVGALNDMLRIRMRRVSFRIHLISDGIRATLEDWEACTVKNLSMGGLFLCTRRRIGVGQQVVLTLEHGETTATAEARSTHVQADGIGFAFSNPSDSLLAFVESVINDLLSEGGDIDDRRDATRIMVNGAIVFSHEGAGRSAHLRDLSQEGAYVVTRNPPNLGTATFVYLPGHTYSLGMQHVSEVRGSAARVVRHGADGFGCHFINPSAEFKMAVMRLLEKEAEPG
jgi:DNA-binding response OmpR family regulator